MEIIQQHRIDNNIETVDRHRQLDSVPVVDGSARRVDGSFLDSLVEAIFCMGQCLAPLQIEEAVANSAPRQCEHEAHDEESQVASLPDLAFHPTTTLEPGIMV